MKRSLRISLTVSAVLSLLSAVSWVTTSAQATQRLEDAVARARAAGVPLSSDEIEIADVPDEENAALLYLEVVERFSRADGFGEESVPLMKYDGTLPVSEELKRALPSLEKTFEQLRRAAELPHCVFPARFGRPFSNRNAFSFTGVHRLTNALTVSAITRAEAEDLDGAVQDLRASLALGVAVASRPSIANQMVRIAGLSRVVDAARVLMTESVPATETFNDLGFPSVRGSVAYGIAGEMTHLGVLFGEDGKAPVSTCYLLPMYSDASPPRWLEEIATFMTRPYWRETFARIIDYNRECALASRLSYPEGLERMNQLVAEVEDAWNPLMRMACVKHASYLEHEARAAARIELLRLGALLLDHRRSTGSYPEALTDLDGLLPLDPTTGAPFLLERNAGDVILRSESDDEIRWRLPS